MRRSPPPASCKPRRHAGFTLVELVMVLVVIGTLAVFALPKALDLTAWRLRAYADDLQSQMLAAQRSATVQRRPVTATITAGGVAFAYAGGAVLADLPCPAGSTPCIAEAGSRSVTFNAGNGGAAVTSTGAALPVTVAHGDTSIAYVVETETGLFRPAP